MVIGNIQTHLKDKVVNIGEDEFYIVLKGDEHKPVAKEEAHVLMFKPKYTEQTAGVGSELKVDIAD